MSEFYKDVLADRIHKSKIRDLESEESILDNLQFFFLLNAFFITLIVIGGLIL